MRNLDLDAARKARAELLGEERPTMQFGGRRFTLPREAPFAFGEELYRMSVDRDRSRDHLRAALEAVLGEQLEAFVELDPSEDDVAAFLAGLRDLWEGAPGESEASAASSSSGSRPSKRTSKGSTGSTSARSAGAPAAPASVGSAS